MRWFEGQGRRSTGPLPRLTKPSRRFSKRCVTPSIIIKANRDGMMPPRSRPLNKGFGSPAWRLGLRQAYDLAKRARGGLDFDDLLTMT